MNKLFLVTILAVFCSLGSISAQTYKISGVIEDTLGNALISSTVLLLEKADSTLVEFTQTEMDGSFRFKDIPAGNHLVKSTYLGYVPLTTDASSLDGKNIDLGTLKMIELAEELMEVVIKAAKAPIKMRGDTIEYDASTFTVPEGSTVEDLLKRLPGIEVESDGSINADGKAVDRVTVDGKSFFGSDPKAATKNLPAEGISKVQVFDTKTEEQKITGSTSESENKTMNLELKEEFKSGGFGKVIASAGDQSRKELKGNYNKFNKKIQFSLVGVGNNTGRNGLSWDDYQDFMGAGAWNMSNDGDYGFGGGSGFYTMRLGGSSGIEQSIQNLFFTGERSGYPENYSAGINFNYDHNKNKLSSVYYYTQNNLLRDSNRDQDKFYQAFTQNEEMQSSEDDTSRGHRVELSYEKEIDSLHSIKVEVNGSSIDNNTDYSGNSSLARDGLLTSRSAFNNMTNRTGNLLDSKFIFRKKFQKKGRRIGFNTSFLATSLEDNWNQSSTTDFLNENLVVDSSFVLNQENINDAEKQLIKANALYVEPLSKKFFSQTFFNFRNRTETGSRQVEDIDGDNRTTNDFLSRSYENEIQYKRAGTALRYSHNGTNISIGGAYQVFDLDGQFKSIITNNVLGVVDKKYGNFIPHASFSLSPNRNTRISWSYNRSANEPEISDLQPLVDNINPLYIRTGNPELEPELSNSFNFRIWKSFPLQDLRISFNANYTLYDSQFSTSESVDENLVTTSTPINVEDGNSGRAYFSVSIPLIRNKIKVRTNYTFRTNTRQSLVNMQVNNTKVLTHAPFIKLDITPSQDYSIYLSASQSISNTSYDLNTSQDQKVKRISYEAEVNAKLIAGIYLSTSLDYSRYTNDRFNQDTSIPIWNSSIYRYFLPSNQLELRLALYDGFNRNVGFNQSAFGIGISQSTVESLSRYGLFSVTYNIRGMKTDVRKKSWW